MIFELTTPTLVALSAIIYYACLWVYSGRRLRSKGLRLPPGPKGKHFVGNLHQISRIEPWLTFAEWGKEYGPVVYYHVFGKETILLSSGKAALDLLESRSSIYSDRPKVWMLGVLAKREDTVFTTPASNPRFRTLRRLLHTGLNGRAAKSYRPIQMQESQVLLKALLNSPENFGAHVRRNAVAVILKVAYGYQVAEEGDPFVHIIEEGFRLSNNLVVPGKYWVEFMPFLRFVPDWFPGAGFKRYAKRAAHAMSDIDLKPFVWAKKEIASGDYVDSFTSKHLLPEDGQPVDEETQDAIKWASAALYVGGGDTTVSALTTLFLVMAMCPEVQKQAQVDIDRVAPNRLPTLDDYNSLPYVRAIVQEILRWAPVAPLGLPHSVTQDDVYEDLFIPKGTRVIANIWAISHDEEMYPDPLTFDPSRHLGDNPQTDPFKWVFGFGRRICPGAHLAEMSLFLNVASVLAVYNISKPVDEKGTEIEPKIEWTSTVTRHLKPFQCQIKPRSSEHVLLIERQI